jgi:hypothetical protein
MQTGDATNVQPSPLLVTVEERQLIEIIREAENDLRGNFRLKIERFDGIWKMLLTFIDRRVAGTGATFGDAWKTCASRAKAQISGRRKKRSPHKRSPERSPH